jgi:hypothetical protein
MISVQPISQSRFLEKNGTEHGERKKMTKTWGLLTLADRRARFVKNSLNDGWV